MSPALSTSRPLALLHRGTAYDPWQHAEALELQVLHRPIKDANALWMPDHHTIVIRSGLGYVRERTALAHGIGHAELGHIDDRLEHELGADQYAAINLISPIEFDYATRRNNNMVTISRELRVTRRLLDSYLALVGRVGRIASALPS